MNSMPVFITRPRWSASLLIILVGLISLIGPSSLLANTTQSDYDVGVNDFRISDMGIDGDISSDARESAVAYNNNSNEYLVVWAGNEDPNSPRQIYGQRLDATTGVELGINDFVISQPLNIEGRFFASEPDVAYNPETNEYLVTWVQEDFELNTGLNGIYGQRLDAATGAEVGEDDFRIDVPTGTDAFFGASNVTYNSTASEYLVVWDLMAFGSSTLVGQVLDAKGDQIGQPTESIGDLSPNRFDVDYHAVADEYLVVWSAQTKDGFTDVYAQRLDATTGAEVGENDIRVSDTGTFTSLYPVVTYNDTTQEYLVAWSDIEEIKGQRLSETGQKLGDTLAISQSSVGPIESALFTAVVYNPADNQYLVTWRYINIFGPIDDLSNEIYGQLLDGNTGAEIGINDFRISDMGPAGEPSFEAGAPALAYSEKDNEYLAVWTGDDTTQFEYEVYGQRLSTAGGVVVQP